MWLIYHESLLSQTKNLSGPDEFKPKRIVSIILCALHKILAHDNLDLSSLQDMFLKSDECLEATILLDSIFKEIHNQPAPTAMLFLDFSKANSGIFPHSVPSHSSPSG